MANELEKLDFWIDDLTNSIRNRISGDSFQTEVSRLTRNDLDILARKVGWNFGWKSELADNSREVFKLTIVNNSRFDECNNRKRPCVYELA